MKLLLYFSFMFIALIVSSLTGKYIFKKTRKLVFSLLAALFSSAVTLSFASCWWLLTEDDGISQGLGILYYTVAFIIILLIDMTMCFKWRKHGK